MGTTIIESRDVRDVRGSLVRWGAVIAGAIWGLATMAVLASLWLALAYPSEITFVRDNLEWFMAGSGAFSLFVAGLMAGALTDHRGAGSGFAHGLTAWAALLIATMVFGLPSVLTIFRAGELRTIEGSDLVGPGASDAMWATFLTLLIGAVAATIGGVIGATPGARSGSPDRRDLGRPAVTQTTPPEPADASPTMATPDEDEERVMVRRASDGSYVDQFGKRYVAEDAGTSP